MADLGRELARRTTAPLLVSLSGPLGSGKTTLVRAWLRALGVTGPVRSPTYTLVEHYPLARFNVHHLDLYRLGDPLELEDLGFRDWLTPDTVLLVEWPEHGAGVLPPADWSIALEPAANGRWIRGLPAPA